MCALYIKHVHMYVCTYNMTHRYVFLHPGPLCCVLVADEALIDMGLTLLLHWDGGVPLPLVGQLFRLESLLGLGQGCVQCPHIELLDVCTTGGSA